MNNSNNSFFAEIIEGNLSQWTGQCWKWNFMPTFGSLVVTSHGSLQIFGIVHTIKTGSMDPLRFPTPYQKTEEELLLEQPQIFEFLQTSFSCITVGYKEHEKIFYNMPGKPPQIHAFIGEASLEQYEHFFISDQFLYLVFSLSGQLSNIDELLLALLKNLNEKKCLNKDNFHDFVETFSMLRQNDYQKLKIFLKRTSHFLTK